MRGLDYRRLRSGRAWGAISLALSRVTAGYGFEVFRRQSLHGSIRLERDNIDGVTRRSGDGSNASRVEWVIPGYPACKNIFVHWKGNWRGRIVYWRLFDSRFTITSMSSCWNFHGYSFLDLWRGRFRRACMRRGGFKLGDRRFGEIYKFFQFSFETLKFRVIWVYLQAWLDCFKLFAVSYGGRPVCISMFSIPEAWILSLPPPGSPRSPSRMGSLFLYGIRDISQAARWIL